MGHGPARFIMAIRMPIRAIFFDLDDTLLETHDAHALAMRLACERAAEMHPAWTAEQFVEAFTQTYRALEAQMEAGHVRFDSQRPFRMRTWEETLRKCHLAVDVAEELMEVYLKERRQRYRLYADVPGVLDQLAPEYRLVLVTNGLGDLQREKIEAVNLRRWFSRIAISGEVGSWKPDSGIFHHALKLAGAKPAEAVMVGDSLERDIRGAAALGIGTVWVRRYPHLQPVAGVHPDAQAEDLLRLGETVARWGTRDSTG
jgi:putative hydrolase of the HAD superfamily